MPKKRLSNFKSFILFYYWIGDEEDRGSQLLRIPVVFCGFVLVAWYDKRDPLYDWRNSCSRLLQQTAATAARDPQQRASPRSTG